jgi:hypothetical protein
MNDPWIHRSEEMRCKKCMWFSPKLPGSPVVEDSEGKGTKHPIVNIGRCRRHAPTMNGYPVVFVNDWCGDHKLNENSL